MGFGFGGFNCGCNTCREHRRKNEHKQSKQQTGQQNNIIPFLSTLSPGACVVLQYDCQPPASGTFQGFQNNTITLSDFDCFPGLVHIAANKINAVSLNSPECQRYHHRHHIECREEY